MLVIALALSHTNTQMQNIKSFCRKITLDDFAFRKCEQRSIVPGLVIDLLDFPCSFAQKFIFDILKEPIVSNSYCSQPKLEADV